MQAYLHWRVVEIDMYTSLSSPFLPPVLERPAESTGEPSPSYHTTGPFPDTIEHRAAAGRFLQQTKLPTSKC